MLSLLYMTSLMNVNSHIPMIPFLFVTGLTPSVPEKSLMQVMLVMTSTRMFTKVFDCILNNGLYDTLSAQVGG